MKKVKIGGIMQSDGRALVKLLSVSPNPEAAGVVCASLAEAGINLELLVQSFDLDDASNFAMVIAQKDLDHALSVLEVVKSKVQAKGVTYHPDVAVISVFGPHLREKPKIPGMMFMAVASVGVGPLAIATSISSVSCVVEGGHLEAAVEALNESFDAPFQVKKRPKEY
jgi:aspartate kinase